jgi:hypothetical protein
MNNPKLKEIFDNVEKKSNKDLAIVLISLKNDFEGVKETILKLTATLEEVEETYNKVYLTLQDRLKFENKNGD